MIRSIKCYENDHVLVNNVDKSKRETRIRRGASMTELY